LYKEEKKGYEQIQNTTIQDDYAVEDDITALLLEKERAVILKSESKIPWIRFIVLLILEGGMLTLILLKGGTAGESVIGVECGTWQYWVLVAASFPYLFIFVMIVGKLLNREHRKKVAVGFKYLKEDLKWTKRIIILFFFFSIISGVAAGFLGIGAGIITGPILLEMGVVPQVSAASSSYMILFTSSATTVQFFILGRLAWQHALWFFGVGLLAAILGQFVLAAIIKKFKKQAFINFLLATVIVLSAALMISIEGLNTYNEISQHKNMGFGPICDAQIA